MARCPYAAEVWDWPRRKRHLVQCERRAFLGSAGWHLHRARLPEPWRTHLQVNVRWRSSSAPDYYVADSVEEA